METFIGESSLEAILTDKQTVKQTARQAVRLMDQPVNRIVDTQTQLLSQVKVTD